MFFLFFIQWLKWDFLLKRWDVFQKLNNIQMPRGVISNTQLWCLLEIICLVKREVRSHRVRRTRQGSPGLSCGRRVWCRRDLRWPPGTEEGWRHSSNRRPCEPPLASQTNPESADGYKCGTSVSSYATDLQRTHSVRLTVKINSIVLFWERSSLALIRFQNIYS